MTECSRLTLVGVLVSILLLGGHAWYFGSTSVFVADALMFLAISGAWGYLVRRGCHSKPEEAPHEGHHQFIKESSAFHMQLGSEIAEQLSSAHTELGNTQAILSDAIGKLVSNFISISDGVRDLSSKTNDFSQQIHEVVGKVSASLVVAEREIEKLAADDQAAVLESNRHVRAIMADLSAFNEAVAKNAVDLNFISGNVEQNVLVVISTLQFQDMSSQLIEHARLRMTALQQVANEMGKDGANPGDQKQYLERIAAYNRLLEKHVVSLDKEKANPVAQKDFGTGDVELF